MPVNPEKDAMQLTLALPRMYDELESSFKFVPPPKRYKIGELADYSGLSRQTLHNYTQWGLISHVGWTEGGHRLYDESAFERLGRILQWRQTHSIEEMLLLLGGPSDDPPRPAA